MSTNFDCYSRKVKFERQQALIAEGVETEEHRMMLREMGCRVFQGYLFSRALPAHEFAHFVERAGDARHQFSQGLAFTVLDADALRESKRMA